jgi:hypothetical protein
VILDEMEQVRRCHCEQIAMEVLPLEGSHGLGQRRFESRAIA